MPRAVRHRGGWFAIDTMIAIGIVAILIVTLTVAVSRQRRGSDRLAQSRAAMRLAEQTITALQTGQNVPALAGWTIKVQKLNTPTDSPAVVWTTVIVTDGKSLAELIGVVRAGGGS